MAGGFGELFGAVFKALGLAFVETLEGQARERIVQALGGRNLRRRKAMQERLAAALARPDFALAPEDRARVDAAVREALFSARGEPVGRALAEAIQRAQWGAMQRLVFYQTVAPSPNVSIEVGSPSASEAVVVDRKTGERRHLRLVEPLAESAAEGTAASAAEPTAEPTAEPAAKGTSQAGGGPEGASPSPSLPPAPGEGTSQESGPEAPHVGGPPARRGDGPGEDPA